MAPLRRRVVAFVLGALLAMAMLPAINIAQHGGLPGSLPALFETEFMWSAISDSLRRIGVSTRPKQVIVGKSGWLFLGDQYAQAITAKRRPADDSDRQAASRNADAMQAWGAWLVTRGVADWHVLLCADKDAIYPEFLPDWDRPVAETAIDAALQRADPRIFLDTRQALRSARTLTDLPLYLRTDSHWTARGAWVAYRVLARASITDPDTQWLQDADLKFVGARLRSGDLARLLNSSDIEGDPTAVATIALQRDGQRTQVDAITERALDASVLSSVEAPAQPVLVRSPHALNKRRILWLRDSFGTALLPYVAATFDEVIEVDRQATSPARLADLVRRFKPNSVLVSVAERNARSTWFQELPPK